MGAGAGVDVLEQPEVAQGVEVVLGGELEDPHQVGLGPLRGQPLGDQGLQGDRGGLAPGTEVGPRAGGQDRGPLADELFAGDGLVVQHPEGCRVGERLDVVLVGVDHVVQRQPEVGGRANAGLALDVPVEVVTVGGPVELDDLVGVDVEDPAHPVDPREQRLDDVGVDPLTGVELLGPFVGPPALVGDDTGHVGMGVQEVPDLGRDRVVRGVEEDHQVIGAAGEVARDVPVDVREGVLDRARDDNEAAAHAAAPVIGPVTEPLVTRSG